MLEFLRVFSKKSGNYFAVYRVNLVIAAHETSYFYVVPHECDIVLQALNSNGLRMNGAINPIVMYIDTIPKITAGRVIEL